MNDNVKNFIKEAEANEELKAKIEALEGADDVVGKAIAIAAEYGYALTEEDLNTVTEEDFKEDGEESSALGIDDLDGVSGGMKIVVVKSPQSMEPILKLIFKVKREQQ